MMFNIQVFILISCYLVTGFCKHDVNSENVTAPKDMYVVRATVYQVGILTNRTNETSDSNSGHQEALTIYHNNGASMDLSTIPGPLLTNVTAEKVLGVAPVTNNSVPWTALQRLVLAPHLKDVKGNSNEIPPELKQVKQKREVAKAPVEVIRGGAVIPSEAGVNSIALPALFTLNKNLSTIPVPIPNMSVVSYTKVNTLVHSP